MKTEEYIIILVGVVADSRDVIITYTSNAVENDVSIQVSDEGGKIIKTFTNLPAAEGGVVRMPVTGLKPGNYTCAISRNGITRDSRIFSI